MPEIPRRPPEAPRATDGTPASGPQSTRPPAFDAEDAARVAGAALVAGRAGLRAALRRGREAAAARGVTEESVKRTVERGRVIAAEQVRRQGQADLPTWPGGDRSATSAERPATNPGAAPPSPTTAARSTAERVAPAPPASRPAQPEAPNGTLWSRVPAMVGRRAGRAAPATTWTRAPLERRVGAFALDLAAFAAAFAALVLVVDLLIDVATGVLPGLGDAPLGLAWNDLFRVVTFQALGDAVGGNPSWGAMVAQVFYLGGFGIYMVGAEGRFGKTAGKHALGLRVIGRRRGERRIGIGLQAAAVRNVCRVYDVLLALWPLILLDLVITLLSPSRQRSGDWFAGTVVIDNRAGR